MQNSSEFRWTWFKLVCDLINCVAVSSDAVSEEATTSVIYQSMSHIRTRRRTYVHTIPIILAYSRCKCKGKGKGGHKRHMRYRELIVGQRAR